MAEWRARNHLRVFELSAVEPAGIGSAKKNRPRDSKSSILIPETAVKQIGESVCGNQTEKESLETGRGEPDILLNQEGQL